MMKIAGVLHLNKNTKLFCYLTRVMRCFKQNEKKMYKVRPRQDSNLESSDPKSDALSIRPRGRDRVSLKADYHYIQD